MCGIFGMINHHKRLLDKRAFITLGCANDSRGGDACGIMIDGLVEKGTGKENKFFQNWYKESSVLTNTEKCCVAIGHCRKASVGGTDSDKAQPVTIYDDTGQKLLFCVIHNGTIYNYEELAKKYIPEIDIKDLSDSQVMAQIFYHKGYDVLQEYEGGGAFVIQDYVNKKTYIFRGESKANYSSKIPVKERPLYFVKTGKSIIFSSIFDILQGLYYEFDVYDMPSNVLLECDGASLYIVKEYDRSECFGFKTMSYQKKYSKKESVTNYYGYSLSDFDSGYSDESTKINFNVNHGVYINKKNKWPLHGIINVSTLGRITSYVSSFTNKYYFWRGVMLCGENAYNAVRNFFSNSKADTKMTMYLARLLSCNPIAINGNYYVYDNSCNKIPFNETYIFPLTRTKIVCDNFGKVINQYENETIENFVPVNLNKELIDKIVSYVKKKAGL